MSRDEVLRFALELARDDYTRAHSRLALIETKAALVAAAVGIFATLLVALGSDRLPLHSAPDGLMCIGIMLSLGTSLVLSLAASLLVSVRPPPGAEVMYPRCANLVGEVGDTTRPVDAGAAEILVGEMGAAYLVAATEVKSLLEERATKLNAAQIALLFALLLTVVWLGLPAVGAAIALIN